MHVHIHEQLLQDITHRVFGLASWKSFTGCCKVIEVTGFMLAEACCQAIKKKQKKKKSVLAAGTQPG